MTDFIEITDLSAPELAPYFQLTTRQMRSRQRPENALFVAESPHVIEAALEAGCAPVSMLLEKKQALSHPALMARFSGTPIYTAPREVLKSLTGYELTRGILCAFRRPAPVPAERILSTARRVAVPNAPSALPCRNPCWISRRCKRATSDPRSPSRKGRSPSLTAP